MKNKQGFQKGHKDFVTKEGRKKIIISLTGRKCSQETREKIRRSLMNHKVSITTRHKISLSKKNIPNLKNSMEGNGHWKGDGANYSSIHEWIRMNYGMADKCENLENKLLTFSCSEKSNSFGWAKKRGSRYTRNISDYMKLCRSCHSKYDRNSFKGPLSKST